MCSLSNRISRRFSFDRGLSPSATNFSHSHHNFSTTCSHQAYTPGLPENQERSDWEGKILVYVDCVPGFVRTLAFRLFPPAQFLDWDHELTLTEAKGN